MERTDEVLDSESAWLRANELGYTMARSSIYRAIRDLHEAGALTAYAVRGGQSYFQKTQTGPMVTLVDQRSRDIVVVKDAALAKRIQAVVQDAGYSLVGGVSLPVVRATAPGPHRLRTTPLRRASEPPARQSRSGEQT